MKNRIVGVCVTTFVVLSLVVLAVFVTLPSARAFAQPPEERMASSPPCSSMSGVWVLRSNLGSTGKATITQSECQATGLIERYWLGHFVVEQLDCAINGYAVTGFKESIRQWCVGARWEITGTVSPNGESFTLYTYPIRNGDNGTCTALFSIITGTKEIPSLGISYLDAVQVVDGQDIPLVKGKDTAIKVRIKNTGTTAAHNVRVAVTGDGVSQGIVTRNWFYREERATAQTDFVFTGDPEDHLDTLNAGEEKTLYFFDDNGALNPVGVENATSWYTVSATVICNEGATDTEQLTKEVVTTKWGSNYPEELRIAYLVGDWPAPRIISPISGAEVSTQAELIKESQRYLGANFPLSASSLGLSLVFDNASSKGFDLDGDGRFNTEELFRWGEDIWLRVGREYPKVDRVVCLLPPGWVCRNAHTPFPCWSWPFDLASGIVPVWRGEVSRVAFVEAEKWDGEFTVYTTAAHELAHTYGVWDVDQCQHAFGLDVIAKQLFLHSVLGHNVRDLMMSGASCPEREKPFDYWIGQGEYQALLRVTGSPLPQREALARGGRIITINGTLHKDGRIELKPFVVFPGGEWELPEPGTEYSVQELDRGDNVLFEFRFDPGFEVWIAGYEEFAEQVDTFPLLFNFPYPDGVTKIVVKRGEQTIASRDVSLHPPQVRIISPRAGETIKGEVILRWEGTDPDGDTLYYDVSWSFDNGQTWHLIPKSELNMTQTSFEWDTSRFATATYRIKVRATDGVNTAEAISEPFRLTRPQYLPLVVKPAGPVPPTPTPVPTSTPVPIPNDGKIWGKCYEEGTGRILRGICVRLGHPNRGTTYGESCSDEDGVYKFDFLQRPSPVTEYGVWPVHHSWMGVTIRLTEGNKVVQHDFTFPRGTAQ